MIVDKERDGLTKSRTYAMKNLEIKEEAKDHVLQNYRQCAKG